MANKNDVLIAIESFAGELEPAKGDRPAQEFTAIAFKTRIRADHPAARKFAAFFAPADSTDDEIGERRAPLIAHEIDAVMATDAQLKRERARREPPPIPLERQVVAINTFTVKGRQIIEGVTVLDRDDEAVRLYPEHFATPRIPLVR